MYRPGSVGDGFARFRRSQEWAKKPPRTREDRERSWVYINPVFGTAAPATVSFELLDRWYRHLIAVKGVGEAGRALKIWRALYTVLVSLKVAPPGDPSKAVRKVGVAGRTATWREGEVIQMVNAAAVRAGFAPGEKGGRPRVSRVYGRVSSGPNSSKRSSAKSLASLSLVLGTETAAGIDFDRSSAAHVHQTARKKGRKLWAKNTTSSKD